MSIVRLGTVGNLIYRLPVFLAEERKREERKNLNPGPRYVVPLPPKWKPRLVIISPSAKER